jgi:hypothetical protein
VFARTYEEHLRNIEIYIGGASPAPTDASFAPTQEPTP